MSILGGKQRIAGVCLPSTADQLAEDMMKQIGR